MISPAARRAFLRGLRNRVHRVGKGLTDVDSTSYVHRSARVSPDMRMGAYGFVGPGCQIDPGVTFGRYVMLASHVAIVGDDHIIDVPGVPIQFAGRPLQTRTEVGDDVWIGYRSVIRRGTKIGRGAVVGANSVVTRDVQPYEIVAGVPARHLAWRFTDPEDIRAHNRMLEGEIVPPEFAPSLIASEWKEEE